MTRLFSGTGNLGAEPALKQVEVDGEERSVADMRIYFDRQLKQDDGAFVEDGGFWLTTSLWGWRAEAAARLLPKGARVFARGRLREDSWEGDDGETRTQLRLDADYLTVDLLCIDELKLRTKRQATDDESE